MVILPILKIIGEYQYSKTVNKEQIQFKIKIWDFGDNGNLKSVDTLLVSVTFNLPKTYSIKKYNHYNSDCLGCESQGYSFFINPSNETKNESDSLSFEWISRVDTLRGIDSVVLSINTHLDIFKSYLSDKSSSNDIITSFKDELKSYNPYYRFSKITEHQNSTGKYSILNYSLDNNYSVSVFCVGEIFIKFNLKDQSFNTNGSISFYKILQSVKIKVEYKGKNEELTKHFQKH